MNTFLSEAVLKAPTEAVDLNIIIIKLKYQSSKSLAIIIQYQ